MLRTQRNLTVLKFEKFQEYLFLNSRHGLRPVSDINIENCGHDMTSVT